MVGEKAVDAKLKEVIKKKKGLYIKMSAVYFSGIPDRLCLLKGGVCFFVELKTTGKKPSKIQLHVHKILTNLGFNVYVIDSYDFSSIKELDIL